MQSKRLPQKKFRRTGVSTSKNTHKTPPQSIFLKRGGVFQNPPRYRISQNPPPLVAVMVTALGTP